MKMGLALLLVAGLCAATGCTDAKDADDAPAAAAKSDAVLTFTAIPDQDETLLRQKFDPVARYLARELGVAVSYRPVADYAGSVDAFKSGDVQLAWFGGLTGVQARAAVPGARAIAQGEEDPNFYSYFIAHADTGVARSESFPAAALKGKRFTFGSPQSTSGRLMPEAFIRRETGMAPSDFFSEVGFSGDHDSTCRVVEEGSFPFGVVNYTVYDRRVAAGETDPEVCRVIWKTPTYADYNFTAHPRLEEMFGEGFIDRLQRALVGMKDEKLLSAFPRKSLIAASNADFEGIEEVARELDFIR